MMVLSETRMDTFGSRVASMVSLYSHRRSCSLLPVICSHRSSSADVINVSGHRLSTAEIESALILYDGVAEAAVIGANDELTGQAVHSFVTLKPSVEPLPSLQHVVHKC